MKNCTRLLLAATVFAGAEPGFGYDQARVLLSDHVAICSPTLPVETARHLVETWGALLCVVQSDELWQHKELLPWVGVQIPPWRDSASAVDTLLAWKDRLNLTTAVTCDDPVLAAIATQAGLRVYRQTEVFARGGVAVPVGTKYQFYQGPTTAFFDRPGRLEKLVSSVRKHENQSWHDLGKTLSRLFGQTEDSSRWSGLVSATHTADSLNRLTGADLGMASYAERWRYCLAYWLAPILVPDTLELFAGQATSESLQVQAREAPIQLLGVRLGEAHDSIQWHASWPVDVGLTPVTLSGEFQTERSGRMTWPVALECRYDTFRFVHTLPVTVIAKPSLLATFVPRVLVPNGQSVREGQLELVNGSSAPLDVHLMWQAEAPLTLTSTVSELTLAPGEKKLLGFALSIPGDLKYEEYTFAVEASADSRPLNVVEGQLWKETPRRTGRGALGIMAPPGSWQGALPQLGVPVNELEAGSVTAIQLQPLPAVLIRGDVMPPMSGEKEALSDFVRSGGVAIVEMRRAPLAWLPWTVGTVSRPGPSSAAFYREELDWWQAPNGLVGGCFAASNEDTVLTLAAGESGFEALLVDEGGKGFMYRHSEGRGWYVLVHSGWFPRLERLERRACLGLLNLISASAR